MAANRERCFVRTADTTREERACQWQERGGIGKRTVEGARGPSAVCEPRARIKALSDETGSPDEVTRFPPFPSSFSVSPLPLHRRRGPRAETGLRFAFECRGYFSTAVCTLRYSILGPCSPFPVPLVHFRPRGGIFSRGPRIFDNGSEGFGPMPLLDALSRNPFGNKRSVSTCVKDGHINPCCSWTTKHGEGRTKGTAASEGW